jgi:23S rRNA pseudouridine955/2504/2580 synthase
MTLSISAKIKKGYIRNLRENILYEDKNILIINKPIGLAVQGGSKVNISVDSLLPSLTPDGDELRLVHRIDKDTSGILLLARHKLAATKLTKMFEKKKIHKTYLALAVGKPKQKSGTISLPLQKLRTKQNQEKMQIAHSSKNAMEAITNYEMADYCGKNVSLMLLEPVTGRKHQLRAHLTAVDLPILGDGKYGGRGAFIDGLANKLHLHAWKIQIDNFFGVKINIKAPLPDHMKQSFDILGFNEKLI